MRGWGVVGYWEKLDEVEVEAEQGRAESISCRGVWLPLVGVVAYIADIHGAWLMLAG